MELGTGSRYARPSVQRRWYDVQSIGTVNIGGTFVFDAAGASGTYTVAADCTGTLSRARHSPNVQYIRRAGCTEGLDYPDLPRFSGPPK